MAAQYVQLIAEGLREFDTRNHNNPEITMDHYVALAWQGLKSKSDGTETKAFGLLTADQKKKVSNDLKAILYDCWCTKISCQ